mmetsp:Transcript_51717/g.75686  ORF Transcript_51717/g.75686 Transcript_51717/m.75686 type:complete len:170 (+) Transcript_51717:143-652(+)|eukprot:CAMPEP_0206393686 /NCGR_PEP_ID=MMETSP0294-20121207/20881_1 /ASSEMBLY_ACC=CAM_ASM_000327 /TAXON_ID=39354 /ORGANISM="Heterosigma akashiwo, Strain CCMP2393" /LENGTH=169 /DNA_ID=CAMNT_0053847361 /DNA_START=132 /DNA_END=641 /DNA_ORIENTATION=+
MATALPLTKDGQPLMLENEGLYLSGFLDKRAKDGKWQKRFFETNGPFITYFKSKRKTKLLAAVRLSDASEITVLDQTPSELDPEGFGNIFCLMLHGRSYYMRAEDRATACKWVEMLTILRHKELAAFKDHQESSSPQGYQYQAQSSQPEQAFCFGFACCGRGDDERQGK